MKSWQLMMLSAFIFYASAADKINANFFGGCCLVLCLILMIYEFNKNKDTNNPDEP